MDKPFKFLLPSPSFDKNLNGATKAKPHFLTPSGMTLLPREKQPPPMYGKRGATVPARYLKPVAVEELLPQPVKQYCEPCELELQSLEDYKRHRAQHEKCPVEGCQYKGHPTVMDKHITSLHSSGLFDKFKKLSSPEEIATWREERRKRFPTVANVLLKQKAQEQRQKRGERLEATRNRFGKVEDRKRAQPNAEDTKCNPDEKSNFNKSNNKIQRNKNRNKKNRKGKPDKKDDKPTKDSSEQKVASEEVQEEESWHGLPAFRGTLQMKDYKHANSKPKPEIQNALFGLVGMYGSDDESQNEEDVKEENAVVENEEIEEARQHDAEENSQKIVIIDDMEDLQDVKPQQTSCEAENNENIDFKCITNDVKLVGIYTKTDKNNESAIENNPPETPSETCNMSPKKTNICDPSNPPCVVNGNSSDGAPEETPIQRSIPEYQINQEKSKTNITSSSLSTQEPAQKHAAKTQPHEKSKDKKLLKRKSGLDYRKLKIRKQNTMLEKLLESDIRHERNVLLQCVRYVCESNFFGVGSKSSVG